MSALGTSNITTSLVRSTLGESNNRVSLLCRSVNINMFSKRKPVRDSRISIPANEVGTADNYGIVIPTWDGTNQAWTYNRPRGGANEPFRLGDFRGYLHSAEIPVILNNYVGYIKWLSYNSQLQLTGMMSVPDADSPNIALQDVLTDYYFAVQLTNDHSETVWGTNANPNELAITIDFTAAPFNTANWKDATITAKFFMSSVAKTFVESDKTATKKAIHYNSTNLTTQQFSSTTGAYISAEILKIRTALTSGEWLDPDGVYNPEHPPSAMVTGGTGGIALRCRLYNKLDATVEVFGTDFKFGTPSNYHGVERYIYFTEGYASNLYDLHGDQLTSLTIQPESYSSEFILYDSIMLSYKNGNYQVPSPAADAWFMFNIKLKVLGSYISISTSTPFMKRCASA